MNWISVKERLPNKDGEYLGWRVDAPGTEGYYEIAYFQEDHFRIGGERAPEIVLWLPLPPPPKEGG